MPSLNKTLLLILGLALGTACAKLKLRSATGISASFSQWEPAMTGSNVIPISVNGSTCSLSTVYMNKPCVTVTVCTPNGGSCVTINDILLDTGSTGLRVFRSALGALNLSSSVTVPAPANFGVAGATTYPAGECVQFADGSSLWGPLKYADVRLGGEIAANIPIQVIDADFHKNHYDCGTSQIKTVADANFNGILGVGQFALDCDLNANDCGSNSAKLNAANGFYFYCSNDTAQCLGALANASQQVVNPVSKMSDSNGVVIKLPSVASGGQGYAEGYLVLGIASKTNNTPESGTVFLAADKTGMIRSSFAGNSNVSSFFDTGSNGLFFPAQNSTPDCGGDLAGWFCPSGRVNLSAVIRGASGPNSATDNFSILNFRPIYDGSGFFATNENGGDGGDTFDFGLPFHFGKSVYVGIQGRTAANVGVGPFVGYHNQD